MELCKSGVRNRSGGRLRGEVCGEVRGNIQGLTSRECNANRFPILVIGAFVWYGYTYTTIPIQYLYIQL